MASAKILVYIDIELEDIVPGYLEKRKKEVLELKNAIQNKDFPFLQTVGHRLKGSAGGYGLVRIGELGKELEEKSKEKNEKQIVTILNELEFYIHHVTVVYKRVA